MPYSISIRSIVTLGGRYSFLKYPPFSHFFSSSCCFYIILKKYIFRVCRKNSMFSGLKIISKGFWPINFGIRLPDKRTGKFQSSCFFHHFVFVLCIAIGSKCRVLYSLCFQDLYLFHFLVSV